VTDHPDAQRVPSDQELLERALFILHEMSLERTGWRGFFSRWYYSDEPLRNDAANLVRLADYHAMRPYDTKMVGDPWSGYDD
jgi:hypothetical protein